MRKQRFLAATAAGVTAVAFIGACAGEVKKLEPKLQLRTAAQHLGDAKQAGFTLKLTGSADELIAATKSKDDDATDLRTLFNSSVTVAYDLAGDGPDDDRMSLAATVDGVTGTEIRVVDKTLYAKAPVTDLAKKFGAGAADIDSLREDATADAPALKTFFDGGWVSLDAKQVADLTGETAGLPTGDVDAVKTVAELKKTASNLFDGADIVRDSADPKHLTATTSTTKAYSEMKRLVTAVAGKQSAQLTDEMDDPPKDRPIVLDLWIDNDKLTALEVNILQFVDGATGRAAVRLETTTGAAIDAPQGATKIDPSTFSGLGGGPVGGLDESAVSVAEMIGYQAQELAEEDGGKPADHLKEAVADLAGSPFKAKIIRRGVVEVTTSGGKACLKVSDTPGKEAVAVKGAC
jgi:hypothetical protein